eukprot:TRINITY_DN8606_c0_g2_i1.p1 TRINITY_DN8606_c0_g2~~TRINITY_DN8606_c0_g2_i1.p1  ORF type:complete len:929 (+),score=133.64 TRINITY_DN8606_c0_g2_i1:59-2845(+)
MEPHVDEPLIEDQEAENRNCLQYFPVVLQAALPEGVGQIEGPKRSRLQLIRLSWMAILAVFYAIVLLDLSANTEMTSGVRQEIADELFPDGGKASERIKEGEVVTGAGEVVNAGDVADILTWFTTYCRMKAATDKRLVDSWLCNLDDIDLGKTRVFRWDASTNRALPDDGSDGPKTLRKRPVFNFSVPKQNAKVSEERYKAIQTMCSQRFLNDHMVIGDDPISQRKGGTPEPSAPFNNPKQFAKNFIDSILKEFSVSEDFENIGGDPSVGLDQIVAALDDIKAMDVEKREEDTNLKKDIVNALNDIKATNVEKQEKDMNVKDDSSTSLEESKVPEDSQEPQRIGTAASDRQGVSAVGVTPGVSTTAKNNKAAPSSLLSKSVTKHNSRQRRKKSCSVLDADADRSNDPVQPYSPQCFDATDLGGLVREAWTTADRDGDLAISFDEQGAKRLVKFLATEEEEASLLEKLNAYDNDKDGMLSVREYYQFIRENVESLSIPGRGYLTTKCRNHHFGLIALCKPMHITATYTTERVERRLGGEYTPYEAVTIRLHFHAAGGKRRGGWYHFQYQISSYSAWGNRGLWQAVLMCICLVLIMVITVFDFLLTMLLWPVNLLRLLCFRIPRGTSLEDASNMMWSRIHVFFDWRLCRTRYLTFCQLLIEHSIAALFVYSIYEALLEAFTPSKTSNGAHSPTCMRALLEMDLDWMSSSLAGEPTRRGLTPVDYLRRCRDDIAQMPKFAELLNILFFETEGKTCGFVLVLILLRVSQILEYSESLQWLPNTLALARKKVIEFTIALIVLITTFAVVLHIQFGNLYMQYSSVRLSFITLFMYSFGDTGRATDGMHPFIEKSSTKITLYLLAYTVLVVTICLNVFTTIVIDAYSAAADPEELVKVLKERDRNSIVWFIRRFAEDPEEYTYTEERHRKSAIGT